MTDQEREALVRKAIIDVAPDVEGEPIDPKRGIREQFDLDSMDFLNVVIALSAATGLDIPEKDYPHLQTLPDAVDYLRSQGA